VRRAVLVLVSLVLLSASCTEDPGQLQGHVWILDPSTVAQMGLQVPAGTRVDLRFEGADADGTAACNTYSATYDAEGADLRFGQIVATTRACDEAIMALEQRYLEILAGTDSYEVEADGSSLILSGGPQPLAFTAEGSEPDRD
jgi:heat shock protein HslJ